jgi:transcriptional regulator with XRE-family HTH domain
MATALKVERVKRDLSQEDLVMLTFCKLSQPRISQLERGVTPRLEEVEVLAKALGMSPRELWPDLAGVEGLEAGE